MQIGRIMMGWALGALLMLPAAMANTNPPSEVDVAKQQLDILETNLDYIRANALHVLDEGRIYILQKSVKDTKAMVESRGLGNLGTLGQYQQLMERFRFSQQFFEFIRTTNTEKRIAEMLITIRRIREHRGFDEYPYGQLLKSNLDQLHASLAAITKQDATPSATKDMIKRLAGQLGDATAEAMNGDRPRAFEKAKGIYLSVRTMYPTLQQLSYSPTTFRYVLEVMGLNELLAERVQYESEKP